MQSRGRFIRLAEGGASAAHLNRASARSARAGYLPSRRSRCSPDMIAQLAPMVHGRQVGDLRRYHMGTGKRLERQGRHRVRRRSGPQRPADRSQDVTIDDGTQLEDDEPEGARPQDALRRAPRDHDGRRLHDDERRPIDAALGGIRWIERGTGERTQHTGSLAVCASMTSSIAQVSVAAAPRADSSTRRPRSAASPQRSTVTVAAPRRAHSSSSESTPATRCASDLRTSCSSSTRMRADHQPIAHRRHLRARLRTTAVLTDLSRIPPASNSLV